MAVAKGDGAAVAKGDAPPANGEGPKLAKREGAAEPVNANGEGAVAAVDVDVVVENPSVFDDPKAEAPNGLNGEFPVPLGLGGASGGRGGRRGPLQVTHRRAEP